MPPEESFAAKNAPLFDLVRAARAARDTCAERQALEELFGAYTRLGQRLTGTVEEQNAYIVARRLGALPDALVELGVREEDLPVPASRRSSPPPAARLDHGGSAAQRFAHLGGPDDEGPSARYVVKPRPEDNMRLKGRLLEYAVIDTNDGLPVGWYWDRDWAETVADAASRIRDED
ncbi:hypothetical protein ABZ468_07760 [Streptomyces sp. NPDC005708]|uniref:hypothetical protein n=1 Tax=Streptomyces sp. NPDC005708 TaxID=3154564 RepID=UPI0033CF1755